MRLRTNARVTATGPKKSKMQQLIERHGLHYAKNFKDTMAAYNTKKRINSIQETHLRQSKETQLSKRVRKD